MRRDINPWFIALTVTLATFMELLDTAVANVSLPHIAGGMATSYDETTWVLTSYLIANAVVLPPKNASGNFVKVIQRLPVRIRFHPNQDSQHTLRPGMSVEPIVTVR